MTLLQDYKTGNKIGVRLDDPICSAVYRRDCVRKRDEFFYNLEESPFFADKAFLLKDFTNDEDALPFAHYTKIDNDAGEGGQLDSDCFSWSTRFAVDITRVCEGIHNNKDYIESSATCLWYGNRRDCGRGMTVYDVINGIKDGLLLEKVYETSGGTYDFTNYPNYYKYGVSKWCRNGPPDYLTKITKKYSINDYAIASSMEEIDANLNAGRGWSCGSSIGVSSQRDEIGASNLKGSWAHAMGIGGRLGLKGIIGDLLRQRYRQPLYIWDNSWKNWNRGVYPQWAKDLGIRLPNGWFALTRDDTWRAVRARQCITFSNIKGFPKLNLPNLGTTGRI